MKDRPTVLVVDDNPANVEVLGELLSPTYRVLVATSGESALATVAVDVPDLVLLDVMMPGMDGYEVCRRLRADPVASRIPVIFASARTDPVDEQYGLDLGAVDYVTKPISAGIVLARVRTHLQLFDQRRALESEVQRRTLELQAANVALANEVVARQRAMDRAEFLFMVDAATGLPNRRALVERIRSEGCDALVAIGLDGDRLVRTTLTDEGGDRLAAEVAARIRPLVRSGDALARVGASEFVVLLHCEVDAEQEAKSLCVRAAQEVGRPLAVSSEHVELPVSSGYVLATEPACAPEELLRRVESALEHARLQGGGRVLGYDADLDTGATATIAMESRLRQALASGALVPHYQPKVAPGTGVVVGAEALVRWPLPDGTSVLPAAFIPVAERSGLIARIDAYVLERVCEQLAQWRSQFAGFRVAVKLSAVAFQDPDLPQLVADVLARTGAAAAQLELEITEHALMTDIDEAVDKLQQVRDLGVHITLDDFGTGYSSMAYLRRLPLDVLKVDQSFVRELETDPNTTYIVRAIISMAHRLGLSVVAEGIETEGQRQFVVEHEVDSVQGWLFAPALTADAMTETLAAGKIVIPT